MVQLGVKRSQATIDSIVTNKWSLPGPPSRSKREARTVIVPVDRRGSPEYFLVFLIVQVGRHGAARGREFKPIIDVKRSVGVESRAVFGRLAQVTSDQLGIHVREDWGNVEVELPGYIFRRGREILKSRMVLIQELVIETVVNDFPGAIFHFADVDQHSV